jgi:hypothetical protein
MSKDISGMEASEATGTDSSAKTVTEKEYLELVARLDATLDVFRQLRELREALLRWEDECRAQNSRIAELEGIMRQFAPILLNAATTIELVARNERRGAGAQSHNA